MKIQIDLKSVLCGLFVGIAVMFCVAAGTSSNPVGKYQVRLVPSGTADMGYAVIVDTQTGRAWGATLRGNWRSDGNFFDAKDN